MKVLTVRISRSVITGIPIPGSVDKLSPLKSQQVISGNKTMPPGGKCAPLSYSFTIIPAHQFHFLISLPV